MSKKAVIEQFKQELSKGKAIGFWDENFLAIIKCICEEIDQTSKGENAVLVFKSEFVLITTKLFTTDSLKAKLGDFLAHLISKNKSLDSWEIFAQKVKDRTGFSKDKSTWNRYLTKPPKLTVSAEAIFYLLFFENPEIFPHYVYSSDNPLPKKANYSSLNLYIVLLIILLFLIAVFCWKTNPEKETLTTTSPKSYFLDSFFIEDVNSLLDNGWQILDPDQRYLDTLSVIRHEGSYLHLFTLEGDYWDVWGGASDQLKIPNMFVHRVECTCCMITTKIDSFFPTEAHQQAGIFLYDDLTKENYIRITYKYREKETEYPNTPWIQVIQMKNKKMTDLGGAHFHRVRLDAEKLHKSIGLKIEITDDKIRISYNYDNHAFLHCFEVIPFFDVNYVGLGAFQGTGLNATIIPARFDFIEVKTCNTKIE